MHKHLKLSEVLNDADLESSREIGLQLLDTVRLSRKNFDNEISRSKFNWDRELESGLVGVQAELLRLEGLHETEILSVRANEGSLREQNLQVNQVVVDLNLGDIDVVNMDRLGLCIDCKVHLRLHLDLLPLSFLLCVLEVIQLYLFTLLLRFV